MRNTITLLLLALLPLNAGFGQAKTQPPVGLGGLDLEVFDLPNGEPGNHVQAIAQDRFGFMWFGSQYGLHRWDGNQFKTYLNDPSNPRSISGDYIETIFTAKDGTLWVGTWGAGLNHFDQKSDKFTRYYQGRMDGLSSNFVNAIAEDREGKIWIGTQDGLDRLDPQTGEIDHFRHAPGNDRSLNCNQVRALLIDSKGSLWVGTGFFFDDSSTGGLHRFRPDTEDFDRYISKPGDPNSLSANKIRSIFEDAEGNLWIGTDGDGLHLMNPKTGSFKRFQNNGSEQALCAPPSLQKRMRGQTTFILQDQDHRFWLGNWMGGIKCFDPATGNDRLYNTKGEKGSSLLENNAWTGYQSKDGVLWFSTASDAARVYRTAGRKGLFHSVFLPTKTDFVKSFAEGPDKNLYFSTDQNLVGKLQPQPLGSASPEYRDEDAALAGSEKIVKDAQGMLWGMMQFGGLVRYDPARKTVQKFSHQPTNPKSLPAAPLRDLLPDKNGNLWLATYGAGLVFFDKKTEQFTAFRHQKDNENSLPHNYTGKLFMDPQGSLWITGSGKPDSGTPFFIARFEPHSKKFTRYQIYDVPADCNFWQSPPVQDKAGNIWVCLDGGLLKLTPESGECSFFDQKRLGKKGSRLKGMVMDNDGRLWIMSDALLAFDPLKETVFSYGVGSGLKAFPFEQDAIFKSEKGEIFLSGRNGIHFFDPRQLDSLNLAPPAVRITGFELLETSGPENRFDASVMQGKPLQLNHDENVFLFSFSALDFNNPGANRLEFMLEGFDQDWRVAGQDLKATYVKVPPGSYLFRVRGANSYGVWGEDTAVVLRISPPWWGTWWAWALYALFAAGSTYATYRFLLDRRLEKSETLRLKELDSVKNRLFANITHEFRTPLTIILGMASQMKEGKIAHPDEGLDMIMRNGTNLLGLVNQMLELAKMENDTIPLHFVQGDVVGYLKYLTGNFGAMAADQRTGLHFLSDLDDLTMDYDEEKLQQVLSNLLSNALKFTPEGGNVYVSVSMKQNPAPQPAAILIKVRDTGTGIAAEKQPHVFDRFFQASEGANGQQGSGIGLALTKELVKLMGGEISVRSKMGEGSEFIVALPVKRTGDMRKTDQEPQAWAPSSLEPVATNHQDAGSPPAALPAAAVEANNGDHERPLLLLIEDNPDVMAYLRSCLANDYRLATASDGREGTELATRLIPDLVVTDVMMPVMDGYQACRFLKNDERTSHVPVVMLTAKAGLESRLEGLETGADAYLAKPFHREELLGQLKNLLEARQRLQKHYRSVAGIGQEHFPIKLAKQQPPPLAEPEDYFVKKVRRAVEAHLDDYEFNVEELCKEIGLSHSHLHRKLSALTGCSASKFIRHIRLNKAKELLESPAVTITSVAFDTGFNDPGYFGRVFKQEFGLTPVEWRERMSGVEN